MKPNLILTKMFFESVVRTPKGRALILNQIADAEDNGEAQVFDQALAKVDDSKLAKMIERHRDDEIRHGRLFRECIARTGFDPGPVPAETKLLDRMNRALGGFFDAPIEDTRGVMRAYLILQVIEEPHGLAPGHGRLLVRLRVVVAVGIVAQGPALQTVLPDPGNSGLSRIFLTAMRFPVREISVRPPGGVPRWRDRG